VLMLGAGVIRAGAFGGDYVPEMTRPIVKSASLTHLHLSRGKHSHVLSPRNIPTHSASANLAKAAAAKLSGRTQRWEESCEEASEVGQRRFEHCNRNYWELKVSPPCFGDVAPVAVVRYFCH
jgi:hypothetical protein